MRANIRYTTSDLVLYARGHSILEHGAPQYASLAQMITGRGEFGGENYSWGDEVIARTASGRMAAGGEPRWRGAGTSHHLSLVARDLATA